MKRLRPGASEVFKLLVPCELVAEKKHEIFIRLHDDNRVTFEKLCDRKTAKAVYLLSSNIVCYHTSTLVADSIRSRLDNADVRKCMTCESYVALGREPYCMIGKSKHRMNFAPVPWWKRVLRVGRVRS